MPSTPHPPPHHLVVVAARTPEGIRFRLQREPRLWLIVLDEIDRVKDSDPGALSLLADTLKTLADHQVDSTIMIVGVAASIEELVGGHESAARSLVQVSMPRMDPEELRDILDKRLPLARLTIESQASELLVRMAEGLPHFVHLLALYAGTRAIEDDRSEITRADVDAAIAVATSSHTMMSDYQRAVRSNQRTPLFAEVLLACAFAPKDYDGWFKAGDVTAPFTVIVGRKASIQTFAWHLRELTVVQRNSVLVAYGEPHRVRYRFRDPLLQPFIKLRARASNVVGRQTMDALEREFPPTGVPESDWPTDLLPLV